MIFFLRFKGDHVEGTSCGSKSKDESGLALDADQEYQKFETQRQPQRQQQHTSNSSNNSHSTSSKDKGSNRGKNGRPCEICQAT